jgi:hypothetical protein
LQRHQKSIACRRAEARKPRIRPRPRYHDLSCAIYFKTRCTSMVVMARW